MRPNVFPPHTRNHTHTDVTENRSAQQVHCTRIRINHAARRSMRPPKEHHQERHERHHRPGSLQRSPHLARAAFVRHPRVVRDHRQTRQRTDMQHEFHRQARGNAERQLLLPQRVRAQPRDQIHKRRAPHAEVVAPRQIQHARVVLLPMRDVKVEVHHPNDVEHANRRYRPVVAASEYAVQTGRYQHGRVRIQPMVEQFAQRSGQTDATRLLAIDAVQRVRGEDEHGGQQPNDVRYRHLGGRLGGGRIRRAGRETPVVPRQHHKVGDGEQESDKRQHVWCNAAREILHQMIPERMHDVQAER